MKKQSRHPICIMARDVTSWRYHFRNWSYRYYCRKCGRERRQNTNFLGAQYVLVCTGDAVARCAKHEIQDLITK